MNQTFRITFKIKIKTHNTVPFFKALFCWLILMKTVLLQLMLHFSATPCLDRIWKHIKIEKCAIKKIFAIKFKWNYHYLTAVVKQTQIFQNGYFLICYHIQMKASVEFFFIVIICYHIQMKTHANFFFFLSFLIDVIK